MFKLKTISKYILLILLLLYPYQYNYAGEEIVESVSMVEVSAVNVVEEVEATVAPVIVETEPEVFDIWSDGVTYEIGIETPNDAMPYAYLKPISNSSLPKPLIVFLHGGGRKGLKTL